MIRTSNPLDTYVRQATRFGPDQAALLADPVARRALLEEIVRVHHQQSDARRRASRRRRVWLGVGLVVVVASLVIYISVTRG